MLEKNVEVEKIMSSDLTNQDKYAALIALNLTIHEISNGPKTRTLFKNEKNIDMEDYDIRNVLGDDHCLYHAILQSTMSIGRDPGNDMGDNPKQLRDALVRDMEANKFSEICKNIPEELYEQLKTRIKNNEWGGELEIMLISAKYDLPITVVNANTSTIINFVPIAPKGIVLLWVNGNHYMWLQPKSHKNIEDIEVC